MEKFTSNYSRTTNNYVIQNLPLKNDTINIYDDIYSILKNIIQRGTPTSLSKYLELKIGELDLTNFDEDIPLISSNDSVWLKTIKGHDETNLNPAEVFYNDIIPRYFGEFSFVRNLMLPEALFQDITGENNEKFNDQKVDFYISQASLVIEIDGFQHTDPIQKLNDNERDSYLKKNGIKVIRINSKDIMSDNNHLRKQISLILKYLNNEVLNKYLRFYNDNLRYYNTIIEKHILASSVLRFQMLILNLLERNVINISDKRWKINIVKDVNMDFEIIALEDLFIWLEHIFQLFKIEFSKPELIIKKYESKSDFNNYELNIDFSLFNRWTDENKNYPGTIFVRTDYFDNKNYFNVSVTRPKIYEIDKNNINDVNSLQFLVENIFRLQYFENFYDGQLDIIINSLKGEDTIGLLPTGGGKSLTYQLTALLQPAISFVVCPIKSLMHDQVYNLKKMNITRIETINSDMSGEEKTRVQRNYALGKYQYVFISPERFQSQDFRDQLRVINEDTVIAMAIIDEVHCLSEWGHDFRTSYLNLAKTIRRECPEARFLGLTATASTFVLDDIKIELGVSRDNIKTTPSYTRAELTFKVFNIKTRMKYNYLKDILNVFKKSKNIHVLNGDETRSGIIFTNRVSKYYEDDGCYNLSMDISKDIGIKASWYASSVPKVYGKPIIIDGGLDKHKFDVQRDFKENKLPLLVATKAFGMGIDKRNIRYTIHYGIPGSLESLYQEAGRAGRDGKKSACYILYSHPTTEYVNYKKLFDPEIGIDDIETIINKKYEGDIFSNFYMLKSGILSIKNDTKLIMDIISYLEPKSKKIIYCNRFYNNFNSNYADVFGHVQKGIYRLSILGIIDDWTIEKWDKKNGVFKVYTNDYDDTTILNSFIQYVHKYDANFSIDSSLERYKKYKNIYNNEKYIFKEKIIRILLSWTHDNFIYTRRQSIKNISEKCRNFKDSEEFKRSIERYFEFNDISNKLETVSKLQNNYEKWLDVYSDLDIRVEKDIVNTSESRLKEVDGALSRLLENYRYNTGLNYISGINRFLSGKFSDSDGIDRFESALESISELDENDKMEILNMTMEFIINNSTENIEEISKVLCKYYSNKVDYIYKRLKDSYSLNMSLNNKLERINKIKEEAKWI